MDPISMSEALSTLVDRWDLRWMEIAKLVSGWSKDPSTRVGAVCVRHNRIVSSGFNGFPQRTSDASHLYDDRAAKYPRIVHAEANSIAGFDVRGGTLYATHYPCSGCAGLIINSGIVRVVAHEVDPAMKERWTSMEISREMFQEAGIVVAFAPVLM